jgi:hypothetical protein
MASGVLYFLEFFGVTGWLRRKTSGAKRRRPSQFMVVQLVDVIGFLAALGMVFWPGVYGKVAFAVLAGCAYAGRVLVERGAGLTPASELSPSDGWRTQWAQRSRERCDRQVRKVWEETRAEVRAITDVTSPSKPTQPETVTPSGSSSSRLVIATEQDAVRSKINKWIMRGEKLHASLSELPSAERLAQHTDEENRSWLRIADHLTSEERISIGRWHRGVTEELRRIGGGAIGIYSADEPMSHALFSALQENRQFLRDRLDELRQIVQRVDGGTPPAAHTPTPTPRPEVTAANISDPFAQAQALFSEAEELEKMMYTARLKMKRSSLPYPMLPSSLSQRFVDWNNRVLALVDESLDAKEAGTVDKLRPTALSLSGVSIQMLEKLLVNNRDGLSLVMLRVKQ